MSVKKVFVGIDPGSKGAICFLDPTSMTPTFVDLSLPIPQIVTGIKSYIDSQPSGTVYSAVIEQVASLPRVSAKSNFNFGYNVGGINWLLMSLGIPLDGVRPKKWQAFVGIKPNSTTIKKDVAAYVERQYPAASIYGPRGGLLDGRSDALAISHYHYKHS